MVLGCLAEVGVQGDIPEIWNDKVSHLYRVRNGHPPLVGGTRLASTTQGFMERMGLFAFLYPGAVQTNSIDVLHKTQQSRSNSWRSWTTMMEVQLASVRTRYLLHHEKLIVCF